MKKKILFTAIVFSTLVSAEYLMKQPVRSGIDFAIQEQSQAPVTIYNSCKEILDNGESTGDGVYSIDPFSTGAFDVYCDMTSDGGGWTAATMIADTTTRNFFETGNTNKITSVDTGVTAGKLSEMWHDNLNKDILLRAWSLNTAKHDNLNQGMVIYDYQKSDLTHLTKSHKESSTFATKTIVLKNLRTDVSTNAASTYSSSGSVTSHYIRASNGNYFLDMYVGDGVYYRGNTTSAYPGGYADYSAGSASTTLFNSDNYFVVFIR